jgi:hypothetical protein
MCPCVYCDTSLLIYMFHHVCSIVPLYHALTCYTTIRFKTLMLGRGAGLGRANNGAHRRWQGRQYVSRLISLLPILTCIACLRHVYVSSPKFDFVYYVHYVYCLTVYSCTCTRICVRRHVYTHTHVRTYIHWCMHTCIHVTAQNVSYFDVPVCAHVYACAQVMCMMVYATHIHIYML